MLVFDIPFLFTAAGDSAGILDLCRKTVPDAIPPSPATVTVWKHRQRISAEWLPVVVYALMKRGIPPRFRLASEVTAGRVETPADLGL